MYWIRTGQPPDTAGALKLYGFWTEYLVDSVVGILGEIDGNIDRMVTAIEDDLHLGKAGERF
jgi:hypothetical protein